MRAAVTRRAATTLVGAAMLLGGCSAASPTPTAAPSTAEEPTPSPMPTDQPASLVFGWPEAPDPVVTRELAGIDERYINPGAIIEHDGQLHMFANVFTSWPGHVDIPHLVSDDGASWMLAEPDPVLTSDDVPFATSGADVSTGFVTDDGTWVLVIESVSSFSPWALGLATATDPAGPWTVDPTPVLDAGAEGAWDAGGLHWPWVVRTDDGYALFYAGFDTPRGHGAIGLATSTDGMTWTKRDEPVLVPEADWEVASLDRPRVAVTPAGLAMIYAGAQLTDRGLAWSDDGISWRRDGTLPAITQDDFPISGRAWDAGLIYRDGELVYYLEIGGVSGVGTNVFRATASVP